MISFINFNFHIKIYFCKIFLIFCINYNKKLVKSYLTNFKFCSKLAIYIEGRYLVLDEHKFVETLKRDIDDFVEKSQSKSVLVFPPVRSKYRFLAHRTVDEYFFPQLCSFSIGQESLRRVVVGSTIDIIRCCLPYGCVHEKLVRISKVVEKSVDCICRARLKSLSFSFPEDLPMPSSICNPSPTYASKDHNNTLFKPSERRRNENRPVMRDRQKRPDKQIYVPRALRESPKCVPVENKAETGFETNSILENGQVVSDKPALCSETEKEKLFETVNSKTNIEKECENCEAHSLEEMVPDCSNLENEVVVRSNSSSLMSGEFCEEIEIASSSRTFEILHNQKSQKIEVFLQTVIKSDHSLSTNDNSSLSSQGSTTQNSDNFCISDNLENSDESLLENLSRENKNEAIQIEKPGGCPHLENEDSWEAKFDDDGECLNPEFFKELKNVTGKIKVLVAKQNYKDFQPTTDIGGCDTIVELYDFPREFSTQDLVSAFSQFQQSSYSIKWVDDCHALAIFSSPAIANQALILNHPFVKVRPIAEGIKESKEKARWCERYSEPAKPRPTTSAVLARRLVSGALGLKVRATKEQRDQERSILNDAKEKRRLKAKQKQAIWDGEVI